MFDTNKVANNIKAVRTKMNMTQMNLEEIVQVAPLVKPDNIVTKAVEEESIDTQKSSRISPIFIQRNYKENSIIKYHLTKLFSLTQALNMLLLFKCRKYITKLYIYKK